MLLVGFYMENSNKKQADQAGASGSGEVNPFARSGLVRSPVRRSEEIGAGSSVRSFSAGAPIPPTSRPVEVMDGAWLTRAVKQKCEGMTAMEIAVQQLGKIIDFASTKSNISKDLKTALLRLRKSMNDAKKELVEAVTVAEPAKVMDTKSTQTEAFAFAGSPKGVADATARDKQSQKRARQPSGEELSGGARKARRILTPKVGSNAGKSDPSQASRKAGKGEPEKGLARPLDGWMEGNEGLRQFIFPQVPQVRANQGEVSPWTKVER